MTTQETNKQPDIQPSLAHWVKDPWLFILLGIFAFLWLEVTLSIIPGMLVPAALVMTQRNWVACFLSIALVLAFGYFELQNWI